MRYLAIFFSIAIILTSCAALQKHQTLDQVRTDLDCIEYKEGIDWKEIHEKFGNPDITPLPEPGADLSSNTRVYKNKIIIFYIEKRKVQEGENVRFQEAVTKIEVCKKK